MRRLLQKKRKQRKRKKKELLKVVDRMNAVILFFDDKPESNEVYSEGFIAHSPKSLNGFTVAADRRYISFNLHAKLYENYYLFTIRYFS